MKNILKYQLLNLVWWTLIAFIFAFAAYLITLQLNMYFEPEFKMVFLKCYLLGLVVTAGLTRLGYNEDMQPVNKAIENMIHFWLGGMATVTCIVIFIFLFHMLFDFESVDYVSYFTGFFGATVGMTFMSRFYSQDY